MPATVYSSKWLLWAHGPRMWRMGANLRQKRYCLPRSLSIQILLTMICLQSLPIGTVAVRIMQCEDRSLFFRDSIAQSRTPQF